MDLHIIIIIIIIIRDIPIASYPARYFALGRVTVLLSLTQTYFNPAHTSTPKEAYNACCHYKRKALLGHIAITSYRVLISG